MCRRGSFGRTIVEVLRDLTGGGWPYRALASVKAVAPMPSSPRTAAKAAGAKSIGNGLVANAIAVFTPI